MKKNIAREIVLRILRIVLVILLSFILYPYLIDFIEEHEEVITFGFVISSIIIYLIMLIISGIYLILKKFLFKSQFDNKNKLIIFLNHSLVILVLIFFTINFQDYLGFKYSVLSLFVIETFGVISVIYDEYFESDEKTQDD
ncbi:hypothetical protein RQM59_01705 [Flavobacteriaceae bacterium S356]|uniref:Uncharacterized protein n=1 Tax=Asprobacillus argus TaxID=3076534 RepID=A0ABU3LDC2_9FLAO|nr:hypothetical protein [Flavobacteriaceae bacterium S356]